MTIDINWHVHIVELIVVCIHIRKLSLALSLSTYNSYQKNNKNLYVLFINNRIIAIKVIQVFLLTSNIFSHILCFLDEILNIKLNQTL